jgi:hypothetical protein
VILFLLIFQAGPGLGCFPPLKGTDKDEFIGIDYKFCLNLFFHKSYSFNRYLYLWLLYFLVQLPWKKQGSTTDRLSKLNWAQSVSRKSRRKYEENTYHSSFHPSSFLGPLVKGRSFDKGFFFVSSFYSHLPLLPLSHTKVRLHNYVPNSDEGLTDRAQYF